MNKVLDHLRRAVLGGQEADLTDGQLLACYISRRDEAAFATLVQRHGPMVWGVCRRVLGNPHDADDAFQATFLVLVRKAASILPREMVGNWLYGVAHQTALKARALTAKRWTRERQMTPMPEPEVVEQDCWRDLQPLLDQELSALPDKYRAAVVLCDLEGKSRKEAARHLQIPEGTLSSRLTTARTLLAKRLTRHGFVVSAGVLARLLSPYAASAGAPPLVVSSSIKAASLLATEQAAAAGLISAKAAALTKGVLASMLLTKLKTAVGIIVAVTFVGITVGLVTLPMSWAGQPVHVQSLPSGATSGEKAEPREGVAFPRAAAKPGTLLQAVDARLAVTLLQIEQRGPDQEPGLSTPKTAKQPPGRTSGVTQILFSQPAGAKIKGLDSPELSRREGKLAQGPETLEIPGRCNFAQGKIYRLKLSEIPSRPGLELFPSLEIPEANPRTKPFLAHTIVRIAFTEEDLDAAAAGDFLTKVVYLPDAPAAAAAAEELISHRVDPGVDVIAEARRQGQILAVVRLGDIDLQVEEPARNTPAKHSGGVDANKPVLKKEEIQDQELKQLREELKRLKERLDKLEKERQEIP
jgi:RNA polymerase sigma factor (sigma-70 family)